MGVTEEFFGADGSNSGQIADRSRYRGPAVQIQRRARTAYLNEFGLPYTVIRFTNREVFNQCEAVVQQIADECQRLIDVGQPHSRRESD